MTDPLDEAARAHAAEEKQRRALELRQSGLTYDEIADQLGYANRSGAYKAVAAAIREQDRESIPQTDQLDLARLDQLLTALWPKAMAGNGWAVERILQILQARRNPERLGRVEAATVKDISGLPEDLRDSALAAVAIELARNIDNGVTPSTCARELRGALADLQASVPKPVLEPKEGGIASLSARIAARRSASAG